MSHHAKIQWRQTCSHPNRHLRIRPQRECRRHVQKSFRQEAKVRIGLTAALELKLRRFSHSVAAVRAALPSMSLIPFGPFLRSVEILNSKLDARSRKYSELSACRAVVLQRRVVR